MNDKYIIKSTRNLLSNVLIDQAHQISSGLYNELVDNVNGDASGDRADITYENLLTVHHNVLTSFKKLELLQELLGDIQEDIEDIDADRRLKETCVESSKCHKVNSRCNCDDERFNCDCTPNYEFLKKQSGAGCDEFDSDGDTFIDNCEDKTPPRLILKDPNQFRCDLTNLTKLCYNRNTFIEYAHAEAYLLANVQLADDCATIQKGQLSIDVNNRNSTTTCDVIYGKTIIMQNILSLLLLHYHSSSVYL